MPAPVDTTIQITDGPDREPGRWFSAGKVLLGIAYPLPENANPLDLVPGGSLDETARALRMTFHFEL